MCLNEIMTFMIKVTVANDLGKDREEDVIICNISCCQLLPTIIFDISIVYSLITHAFHQQLACFRSDRTMFIDFCSCFEIII